MSNSAAHKRTHFTHFQPSPRKLRSVSTTPSEYVWVRVSGTRFRRMKRSEAEAKGFGGTLKEA